LERWELLAAATRKAEAEAEASAATARRGAVALNAEAQGHCSSSSGSSPVAISSVQKADAQSPVESPARSHGESPGSARTSVSAALLEAAEAVLAEAGGGDGDDFQGVEAWNEETDALMAENEEEADAVVLAAIAKRLSVSEDARPSEDEEPAEAMLDSADDGPHVCGAGCAQRDAQSVHVDLQGLPDAAEGMAPSSPGTNLSPQQASLVGEVASPVAKSPDHDEVRAAHFSLCSDMATPERGEKVTAHFDEHEPMEYAMLDYLGDLPDGLADKLRVSLEVYEDLVQHLCKSNDNLRAKAKGRPRPASEGAAEHSPNPFRLLPEPSPRPSPGPSPSFHAPVPTELLYNGSSPRAGVPGGGSVAAAGKARPPHTRQASRGRAATAPGAALEGQARACLAGVAVSATPSAAELRKRDLREQMAGKMAAAQEARLRLAAEAHEAAMRTRLDRTCRVARERIAAMTRRTQRTEEECNQRASAARLARERMQRDLEAAQRETIAARAAIAELEDAARATDARVYEADSNRRSKTREVESLRSELKAHRARASRASHAGQRLRELQKELTSTLAELGEVTPCA